LKKEQKVIEKKKVVLEKELLIYKTQLLEIETQLETTKQFQLFRPIETKKEQLNGLKKKKLRIEEIIQGLAKQLENVLN